MVHWHSLLMSTLLSYFVAWRPLGYTLTFIGMFVEGDAMLFLTAFLTHQGFFDFGDMLFTVVSGVLIGDSAWYWIGYRLDGSKSRLARWAAKVAAPFDEHIKKRPFHTILISKFTYGFHHAILLRAGALRLPFKRYFWIDVIASAVWLLAIGILAYVFSGSYVFLRRYVRYGEIALLFLIVLFVLADHAIAKYYKKKL